MENLPSILLFIGIGIGFYVQTVAGFAAALIALPLMLHVLNIQEAVALLSIFFLIFSVILIFQNRKRIDRKIILEMGVGIILGSVLGVAILKFGNPVFLKKALGVFILLYVGYSLLGREPNETLKRFGFFFGFTGGVFSGLYSIGGPVFVVYIMNKLEEPDTIRAAIIGAVGIAHFVRLPLLAASGILTYGLILKSLYILPIFLIALYFGHKTYHRIDAILFRKIVMALLCLSGVFLFIQ